MSSFDLIGRSGALPSLAGGTEIWRWVPAGGNAQAGVPRWFLWGTSKNVFLTRRHFCQ